MTGFRGRKRLLIGAAVAVACLLALAINAAIVDSDTQPARAEPGSRLVSAAGETLDVRLLGPSRAPGIVLIHGFSEDNHSWERLDPYLRRYRLAEIELLGHGGSSKPRSGYSPVAQARAIAGVIRKLRLCRPLLIGHSLGGVEASVVAADERRHVAGLVLLDVMPRMRFAQLPFLARMATWPLFGELLHLTVPDGMVADQIGHAFSDGRAPPGFVHGYRAMTYTSYKQSRAKGADFVDAHPLDHLLARAGVRPLVIFGTKDRIVKPAATTVWRRVPGVRIAMIHGSGHLPHWEQPRLVGRLIASFARERKLTGCGRRLSARP